MEKRRCFTCNKKLKSLIPIKCKCNNYYCFNHKLSYDHNCNYNYLDNNKENLKKYNYKVISDKFNRI